VMASAAVMNWGIRTMVAVIPGWVIGCCEGGIEDRVLLIS
jgi:hypothetical protein